MSECEKFKTILDAQQQHWNRMYAEEPDFFGEEPIYPAKKAAEILKREGKSRILELGAGQGRDTLFFAKNGFHVTALDYSENAVEAINQKAQTLGLPQSISAVRHDIRKKFPFANESFDACYCHMLYCMALCTSELEALFQEVRRVLKPNGLNIYTVRHIGDAHYGKGIHHGEDMYEMEGFIVHFFNKEKVEHLAKGYELVSMEEFEEGELPRKLFLVMLRKNTQQHYLL
jgi:SAM-dependent methyltransferase